MRERPSQSVSWSAIRRVWGLATAVVLAVSLGAPVAAPAQEEVGNVFVVVADVEGAALPGVTVTLEGQGAARAQVTDARGQARFPALDPGAWRLTAELEGFSRVEYQTIDVRVARSVQIEIALPGAVEEVISIEAESPLLDARKLSAGSSISQLELEKLPTARDPWAVLTQVPGVLTDRINVGGNESDEQSLFTAPGVGFDENAFLVDGVEITDMTAPGGSSTYYDFDQFAEVHLATGGTDVTKPNAGVSVNLVTKRGTNEFRGSARFLRTDDDFFAGFLEQDVPFRKQPDRDLAPSQAGLVGNSIDQVTEYGFEAGGPVARERLWFWGSWATNDIRTRTGGATLADVQADDTILDNAALRINVQLSSGSALVASWNHGDKRKSGSGAGPTRPRPTTLEQRGPTAIYKLEDTHLFGSSFFVSGTWSHVDRGFSLTSEACVAAGGCVHAPEAAWDANGVWQNSFLSGSSSRPSDEVKLDGSAFFDTGAAGHEIKFGGRLRQFEATSLFVWPGGRDLFVVDRGLFGVPGDLEYVVATRGKTPRVEQDYTSLWAQDTITIGKVTINGGLRYDLQDGTNAADSVGGNTAFPEQLPPIEYEGADTPWDWESVTPRLGVTYAVGAERQTLLRASFSQFPAQLGTADVVHTNPLGYTSAYYLFHDLDGDLSFDDDEPVEGPPFVLGGIGSSLVTPNRVASGYEVPLTSEAILAVEHSLLPELVAGLAYTQRLTRRPTTHLSFDPGRELIVDPATGLVRPVTAADYVQDFGAATNGDGFLEGTLPDGTPYSVPLFVIACAPDCLTGGRLLENTDREIVYRGVSLTLVKRLSNRWMLRGYVTYGDSEWRLGEEYVRSYDPNDAADGRDDEGGLYGLPSFKDGRGSILHSTWQYNVNGMVQVAPDRPWGFNLAANAFGREGYPLPYFHSTVGSDGILRAIQVTEAVDSFRTESAFVVDARIEKELAATSGVAFTVALDVFNLLDEDYVLGRRAQLNQQQADWLTETLSPRIYRLGVRLSWR